MSINTRLFVFATKHRRANDECEKPTSVKSIASHVIVKLNVCVMSFSLSLSFLLSPLYFTFFFFAIEHSVSDSRRHFKPICDWWVNYLFWFIQGEFIRKSLRFGLVGFLLVLFYRRQRRSSYVLCLLFANYPHSIDPSDTTKSKPNENQHSLEIVQVIDHLFQMKMWKIDIKKKHLFNLPSDNHIEISLKTNSTIIVCPTRLVHIKCSILIR